MSHCRSLDGGKGCGEVGVEVGISGGMLHDVSKELRGADEIALGVDDFFDGFWVDCCFGHVEIVGRAIGIDILHEVFADEAIEEGAKDVLLEVPSIYGSSHVVGDAPDSSMEFVALLEGTDGGIGSL